MRGQQWPWIVVAVLAASVWSAREAAASFCGGRCEDVANADAIVVATVERVETNVSVNGRADSRIVHLTDIRPLRGKAPATVRTGLGDGDCGSNFRAGTRYLIVAHRRPIDGRLWSSSSSLTQPLADAGALIAYIESLKEPSDGGRVWGRVRLATPGTNIPSALSGAQVTIRGPVEATTTTDNKGDYGVKSLPLGQYVVTATAPPDSKGLIAIPPRDVSLEGSHACAMIDFKVESDSRIRGSVVGPAGTPMEKLIVWLHPLPFDYGASHQHCVETDANGKYEFSNVPWGRYRVGINFLIGPNHRLPFPISSARTASGADVVEVGPGEDVALAPLVLSPLTPVPVDVRVQREDGSPVSDVVVAADAVGTVGPFVSEEAYKPIAPGHYQLVLYRDTSYRILVMRAQKTLRTAETTGGETSLLITLAAPK
jgi:Carboxypeptidase regulatory-like domain